MENLSLETTVCQEKGKQDELYKLLQNKFNLIYVSGIYSVVFDKLDNRKVAGYLRSVSRYCKSCQGLETEYEHLNFVKFLITKPRIFQQKTLWK